MSVIVYVCLFCRAITNSSMRMFIIGHYHKGKTSILRALQGKRPKPIERISGFHARTGTVNPETVPGMCVCVCGFMQTCMCVRVSLEHGMHTMRL